MAEIINHLNSYLGIDWGQARIGLALADYETKLALPFKTVKNLTEILAVIDQENIDLIVLGKPLKLSGQADLNSEFTQFYQALEKNSSAPIVLMDERLTSKVYNFSQQTSKANRDQLAASRLLQDYLDSQVN